MIEGNDPYLILGVLKRYLARRGVYPAVGGDDAHGYYLLAGWATGRVTQRAW